MNQVMDIWYPCITRPSNLNIKNFNEIFKQDVYKLINICYCQVCNHACYKNINDISARLCEYGFATPLMNKNTFWLKQLIYFT
jgi:hypothetical protein